MKSDEQKFTELTGGCWHIFRQKSEDEWATMKCQKCGFETNELNAQFTETAHPTYSNAADILNKMKEFCGEDRYYEFIIHISFVQTGSSNVGFIMSIGDFINTYILNPPLLLKKAIEFLEEAK